MCFSEQISPILVIPGESRELHAPQLCSFTLLAGTPAHGTGWVHVLVPPMPTGAHQASSPVPQMLCPTPRPQQHLGWPRAVPFSSLLKQVSKKLLAGWTPSVVEESLEKSSVLAGLYSRRCQQSLATCVSQNHMKTLFAGLVWF